MSYLRKYARSHGDKLTRQYSTRLSEKDGIAFEKYCSELNLKPTEAVRYLILEELERVKAAKKVYNKNPSTSLTMIDAPVKYQTKPSGTEKKADSRNLISKYKIDDQLPCPECNKWYHIKHYSSRHAKKHGYPSTYDFLKEREQEVQRMFQARQQM